jgi:hypothetical protein
LCRETFLRGTTVAPPFGSHQLSKGINDVEELASCDTTGGPTELELEAFSGDFSCSGMLRNFFNGGGASILHKH